MNPVHRGKSVYRMSSNARAPERSDSILESRQPKDQGEAYYTLLCLIIRSSGPSDETTAKKQ